MALSSTALSRAPTLGLRPKRDVATSAARPARVSGAVAGVPAVQGLQRSRKQRSQQRPREQQVVVHFQQSRSTMMPAALQRAPKPQWMRGQLISQQLQQQHQSLQQTLSEWGLRFQRQVRSLPQGKAALTQLLQGVEALLAKAEHCGSHSGVMKAYLGLGLVDVTSQAWQQRATELQGMQDQMPAEQFKQQQLEAELALSGCRFLRIEAAQQLAKQLHLLLDDEGYCPSLNLGALPAPHALGLQVPQLLRDGLGLDLQNPALRCQDGDSNTAAPGSLHNLSWDEYSALSADQSMCGDWQFCYWVGDATWVPAPFGKFSTQELRSVLTQDTVLASLPNGIWGRALVTAAQEQGLSVASSTEQEQVHQTQQELAAAAGGAGASVPDAVRALIEESMGSSSAVSGSFASRVRQLTAVVAAVRTSLVGAPAAAVPAQGAPAQSN